MVYLKIEGETGSPYFDDFEIIGYSRISMEETVAASFMVYPQGGGIVVQGSPQGESISVYNAAGMLTATAVAGESETYIPLPAKGLYVVKAAGQAKKVVL